MHLTCKYILKNFQGEENAQVTFPLLILQKCSQWLLFLGHLVVTQYSSVGRGRRQEEEEKEQVEDKTVCESWENQC